MNVMYGTLCKHLIEKGVDSRYAAASRETEFLLLIRNLKPRPSISLELVSKELNHLAVILHVSSFFKKKGEILLHF